MAPRTRRAKNDPGAGLNLVSTYLEIVLEYLDEAGYDLPRLVAERCERIEQARAEGDRRYYAHVDCEADVVCFAFDVGKLSPRKQAGLVLHEVGHCLADVEDTEPGGDEINKAQAIYPAGRVHEEATANQAIYDAMGITITYAKDQVQQISTEDLAWLESQ